MKVGDLVTFTPESWGTPLEDRPLYIVVRPSYEVSTKVSFGTLVDIMLPGDPDTLSINPNDLEILSGTKN